MEIAWSARKHGIDDAGILHAIANLIRYSEQTYDGEERIFLIGPARDGRFLESSSCPPTSPCR